MNDAASSTDALAERLLLVLRAAADRGEQTTTARLREMLHADAAALERAFRALVDRGDVVRRGTSVMVRRAA